MPLLLASAWLGFATVRQLSQASPTPSLSWSSWSGLRRFGQLSVKAGALAASAGKMSPLGWLSAS